MGKRRSKKNIKYEKIVNSNPVNKNESYEKKNKCSKLGGFLWLMLMLIVLLVVFKLSRIISAAIYELRGIYVIQKHTYACIKAKLKGNVIPLFYLS